MKAIFFLYSALSLVLSIVLFPVFLCHPRGKKRLSERYGAWNLNCDQELTWFHGASMGEINGLVPVIKAYKEKHPETKLLVTAISVTGLAKAENYADYIRLIPFDNPVWIKNALKDLKIKSFIFGETELWPFLLHYLAAKNTRLVLVNGRISQFSLRAYQLIKWILKPTLKLLDALYVSDKLSQERFITLGADADRCFLVGNAKYDSKPSISNQREAKALNGKYFSNDAPVLVLGSLWPGEEQMLFPPIVKAFNQNRLFNVIVAPRHQERFEYFASKLSEYKLDYKRWSDKPDPQEGVILLDTLGDLEAVYSFADIAFIGGSLVNIGGHNPLEAAAYQSAVAMGPYTSNVHDLWLELERNKACFSIANAEDVESLIDLMLNKQDIIKTQGQRAYAVWQQYAGATKRIMDSFLSNTQQQDQSMVGGI